MRLQKQLSRRVKGKEYPKYVVVLPPDTVKQAGWKEGQELEILVRDGKMMLRPKKG